MDLQLYFRVIRRFRLLVLSGLVVALLLAFLSFFRVDFAGGMPDVSPREDEEWESLSTLFVTSTGFPWGSIVEPAPAEGQPTGPSGAYLASLAGLYTQLATTDPVLEDMSRDGPIDGRLQAFPVSSDPEGRGEALPMVTLSAISATPAAAERLADRHARAFVDYLEQRQISANIPEAKRVNVEVVREPQPAQLLAGRSKTRPIVVFLAVAMAFIGLAFILENLHPQIRVLTFGDESPAPAAPRPDAGNGTPALGDIDDGQQSRWPWRHA